MNARRLRPRPFRNDWRRASLKRSTACGATFNRHCFCVVMENPGNFRFQGLSTGLFLPLNVRLSSARRYLVQRLQHSLSGPWTAYVDIAVISIPAAGVPPSFQFLVQVIQKDV